MKTSNPTARSRFDIDELVRSNIVGLRPYSSARETVNRGLLLDANENPFEKLWQGIPLNRYPDPRQLLLRESLADRLGLKPDNLLAASGSDEILDWVLKVFCQPGEDAAAAISPSYGMYRVQADIHGISFLDFPLDDQFDLQARRFLEWAPPHLKVVFLCSPNNPTGNLLNRGEILETCRQWRGVVVVDEAYIEFAGEPSLACETARFENLVVMRTFSKALGRAAIRLGYAAASSGVISHFLKVKAPYNLSAVTMRMGLAAWKDQPGLLRETAAIVAERERLRGILAAHPRIEKVFPSRANFVLFRCPHATLICQRMLKRGIVVRDRSSMPRLADCIRMTVGRREENDRCLNELFTAIGETV